MKDEVTISNSSNNSKKEVENNFIALMASKPTEEPSFATTKSARLVDDDKISY